MVRNVRAGACPARGAGGWHGRHLTPSINQCTSIFIPWCAGGSGGIPSHESALRHCKAGIQRGRGGGPTASLGTRACPGLRRGIDRSGSHSFAIRGIPSSIRPSNRHSGEGRNPGGGVGAASCPPPRAPVVSPAAPPGSRHPRAPGEPDNSGFRRNPRKARTAQPSRTLESLSGLHQLVQDHCFEDIM